MATSAVEERGWATSVDRALRRLSTVTLAGAIVGLLVGGVGGRLAMMALARLNPEASGMLSDDGFTIGRLTAASFNLLFVGTLLGVLGAGVYFVLRPLMVGPRWFQVLSISVGPAVVVGSMLVHVQGVDFTLDPVWLAIAMFVAIPGVYAAGLTLLAERWLDEEREASGRGRWLAFAPLLLWTPIAPALVVLLGCMASFEILRRTGGGRALLQQPATAWAARTLLAVMFVLSLGNLVRDTVALV